MLGTGGLGQVHEAWDPLLSRPVAVKTLQFDIDTPTRVTLDALFLNEARAAAGLSHTHIVTVHDAGLSAHGVYIAMERLRGRDLAAPWFLRLLVVSAPLGVIAVEAGWTVTEVGRQPWVIQGLMRTRDAVTPMPHLVVPFATFTLLYLVLGVTVVVLLTRKVFTAEDPT